MKKYIVLSINIVDVSYEKAMMAASVPISNKPANPNMDAMAPGGGWIMDNEDETKCSSVWK